MLCATCLECTNSCRKKKSEEEEPFKPINTFTCIAVPVIKTVTIKVFEDEKSNFPASKLDRIQYQHS